MTTTGNQAAREPDAETAAIADYVLSPTPASPLAYETARYGLMDTIGCGLEALSYPACTKLLGPIVPGAEMANGARVPGTSYTLDPVTAAFNIGTMNRWLDFNDAWFGKTGAHPSDNLGAILAVSDWLAGRAVAAGKAPLLMRDVLTAMIQAHEIQGVLALENDFIELGMDNVILVKIASTAVATRLLGGTREEIVNAISNAWVDGHPMRLYRIAPTLGSRKSWAAGDATARGVRLALMALTGEMGYPTALTAPTWGFYDALFRGRKLERHRPYGSHVIENVQFKIAYPTGFHGQTAAECALQLHERVKGRLDAVKAVRMWTHRSARHLITGDVPLTNPAARDHSLQYIAAIGLIFGRLTAADYEDDVAADPRIDRLRSRMTVTVDEAYTAAFRDPDQRANAHGMEVEFDDGTCTERVEVLFPLGHPRRRREGMPLLVEKFRTNLARCFAPKRQQGILDACADQERFERMPVNELMDLFAI